MSELLRAYDAAVGVSGRGTTFPDAGDFLAARLPVTALAMGSVAALAESANRYRAEIGLPEREVQLDPERVAASFASDRLLRIDGKPMSGFAPMSGFFATSDGWVRTHGNYDHHRRRLLQVLGLPEGSGREQAAAQFRTMRAQDVEDRAADAGAIAVRVRTEAEWRATEAARAAAQAPLVGIARREDVKAEHRAGRTRAPTVEQPLRGVRVVDLTRVIAGPVATRALALLGAEVLRLDPPHVPEIAWQHLDVGQGKRSALLDLRAAEDLATLRDLLATADVLVTGYRPGALAQFEEIFRMDGPTDRSPCASDAFAGLVRGRVSAWGFEGPWASRRGFDSIVQGASGIALIEGGDEPGALPAQALDHATGYLLAAGIVDALARRRQDAHGRDVSVSLARTASWLLDAEGRRAHPPAPKACGPHVLARHGHLDTTRPALADHDDYPEPAHPLGTDTPSWKPPVDGANRAPIQAKA